MYIQIDNAGFRNKGAELMLQAIMQRLAKEKGLQPNFVKGALTGASPELVRRNNLLQFTYFKKYRIKWEIPLPIVLRQQFGLVREKDISCILDAGGFQFGDQWMHLYSRTGNKNLSTELSRHKARKVKLIYLPQAFGPFQNILAEDRIKIVHKYADLIYAREQTSYDYLRTLFGKSKKIKLAPDFTNLVKADIPLSLYRKVVGRICIIPNSKMITHSDNQTSQNYVGFLVSVAKDFLSKGEKIILLNHESEADWKLIQDIQQKLEMDSNILTLTNLNALEVKAIIGNCKLVLSSRFHGAVSGFNQRVPTFCTSWSHKYQELVNDYKLGSNILNVNKYEESIQALMMGLNAPEDFIPAIDVIEDARARTEAMWKEVIKEISSAR